jgi:acetylglutamate kinase
MTLVIKVSGKVVEEEEERSEICRQIAQLVDQGQQLVMVHGGGRQLTELSARLAVPTVQYQGRRVTDEATLELAIMVFSLINRKLVAALIGSGVAAMGIAAFDGTLTRCRRRRPIPVERTDSTGHRSVEQIDFGLVGEIEDTDPSLLRHLWRLGLVPVVSCLGADSGGQIFNINADTLAAELAIALPATRLLSVSDVSALYLDVNDPDTRITELTSEQAKTYLRQGRFTDGMVPKIETALKVVERGVASVQIVSGLEKDALLQGLKGEAGTLLRA